MKKLSYKMLILIVCLVTFLSGCEDGRPRPNQQNVNADRTRWKLMVKGKLNDFKRQRDSQCGCPEGNWCDTDYFFNIENKKFVAGDIESPGAVVIGSIGRLYKHDCGSKDSVSWFKWIEDEPAPIVLDEDVSKAIPEDKEDLRDTIKFLEEMAKSKKSIEKPSLNYEWQRGNRVNGLKAKKFVLIKLDSGIITTGFVTYDRKWKLGINRDLYNNGKTLTNVIEWKRTSF